MNENTTTPIPAAQSKVAQIKTASARAFAEELQQAAQQAEKVAHAKHAHAARAMVGLQILKTVMGSAFDPNGR